MILHAVFRAPPDRGARGETRRGKFSPDVFCCQCCFRHDDIFEIFCTIWFRYSLFPLYKHKWCKSFMYILRGMSGIASKESPESVEILDPEARLVPQVPPLYLGTLCLDQEGLKDHQVSLDQQDCQGEMDKRCLCQRNRGNVFIKPLS